MSLKPSLLLFQRSNVDKVLQVTILKKIMLLKRQQNQKQKTLTLKSVKWINRGETLITLRLLTIENVNCIKNHKALMIDGINVSGVGKSPVYQLFNGNG